MAETSTGTIIRGDFPGVTWPPVARGMGAILGAMLWQIDRAQWWPPDRIAAHQHQQLLALIGFLHSHSPAFRRRLKRAHLTPNDFADPGRLLELPPLSRRDLQAGDEGFYCPETSLPPEHRPLSVAHTSGSTGEPVVVRKTSVTHFFWMALTLRDHLWHRRNFRRPLLAIRATVKERQPLENWGPPANLLFETGPSLGVPITWPAADLAAAIDAMQPGSLLAYPSTLAALIEHYEAEGRAPPPIEHIRSIGETLPHETRRRAAEAFKARVADCYSSQELGYLALECPDSGLYHVMAENLVIEVLDTEGRPCREGEIGRVVATDLHNLATPLVRYDIGDYVELAGPCPCGRGLPTFKNIVGRIRNMVLLPDGSRRWLLTGFEQYRGAAPVLQYQFIQHDRQRIEVRLVTERPLSTEEEKRLREIIVATLGFPLAIEFSYHAGRLPAGPSGKFEIFICRAT